MVMRETTSTGPVTAPQMFWSGGDYDRLASYGSAAEAAHLVRVAGVDAGTRVLDVGTGSGTVAIVAAQRGALVTGVDPTPELLAKARQNAQIAGLDRLEWREGVAEALPFADATFDVVLSQFAHMFSPRPEAAATELLRVVRPGGCLAFSAWTPEGLGARLMALSARYSGRRGATLESPFRWGDVDGVRGHLAADVATLTFEHRALQMPALSPGHVRVLFEATFPPTVLLVRTLGEDPTRLTQWRAEYERLVAAHHADGVVRFEYLLTRATRT